MRCIPPSAVVLALAFSGLAIQAETAVQQLLTQGQTEFRQGDLVSAQRDFQTIISMEPHNQTAANFLKIIAAQQKAGTGNTPLERQVSTLILPKVEYKEATLDSVLDSLKRNVAKLTDNKVSVNFVPALPSEQLHQTTVTLSLSNVPLSEVLRYIGSLANVQFVYDKYAITVKPAAGAPGATTASATGTPTPDPVEPK